VVWPFKLKVLIKDKYLFEKHEFISPLINFRGFLDERLENDIYSLLEEYKSEFDNQFTVGSSDINLDGTYEDCLYEFYV
jgi:hypothetical protein